MPSTSAVATADNIMQLLNYGYHSWWETIAFMWLPCSQKSMGIVVAVCEGPLYVGIIL